MDQAQRRQFVRDHRTCVFGYGRKEHGPAMTVVYYVMDGDDMLISTMAAREKAKAVARDGRVSLCVLDERWPLSYVQVYGYGVVEPDRKQAVDVLTRVIGLMAGEEVPESRRPQIEKMADDERRVVIRVTPYATFVTPPRHVWKMSDIDTLTHHTSTSMPWLDRRTLMTVAELLADAFGRIREVVHETVEGLTPGQLALRPESEANSIGWLIWHLTRIQDDHVADAAGTAQVWTSPADPMKRDGEAGGGYTWADRFGLPFATSATGYGHGAEAVAAVQVRPASLLTEYYDAVHTETVKFVSGLSDADLDRIVDYAWDPPVSLGVRLISVISDDLQHAGQAAYLRGLIERGLGG